MIEKIGLIGVGTIGQAAHLPALSREGHGFKLVAVSDLRPPISSEIPIFPDYRELLHKDDIVAVSIATPPDTHRQIALDALRAGKHVLVEKPPARNIEELEEMEEVARAAGKVLFTAFHTSYRPEVIAAAEVLKNKEIMAIRLLRREFVYNYHNVDEWIFNPQVGGGGALIDAGINLIAQLKRVLPNGSFEIKSAKFEDPKNIGIETRADVIFSLKGGEGNLYMDWLHEGSEEGLMVFTTPQQDEYIVDIVKGQTTKNGTDIFRKGESGDKVSVESTIKEYEDIYRDFADHIERGESYVGKEELQFVMDAYKVGGLSY